MLNALRSEVIKQATLRSTAVYFVLLIGSLFGPVVLLGLIDSDHYRLGEPQPWGMLLDGFLIFAAIAIAFAASRTTSDIKNHMTAQSFLTQPGRWQSLVAKFVVLLGFVVVSFAVGAFLIVVSVMAFGGRVSGENLAPLVAALAMAVTVAAVGIGFGALVRNAIAAVALPLVWLLIGETLVQAASSQYSVLEPAGKVLLTQNYMNLGGQESVGLALAVFAAWIATFALAGFASNQLRDVR